MSDVDTQRAAHAPIVGGYVERRPLIDWLTDQHRIAVHARMLDEADVFWSVRAYISQMRVHQ